MDIEKIAAGAIGAASSAIVWAVGGLIKKGRKDEQFDRLHKDIDKLEKGVAEVEKMVSEKVSLAFFKEEIAEIHGRISRTQREQATAIDKLDGKVDRLSDSVNFVHGVVSSIPAKLDSIKLEIEKSQR